MRRSAERRDQLEIDLLGENDREEQQADLCRVRPRSEQDPIGTAT